MLGRWRDTDDTIYSNRDKAKKHRVSKRTSAIGSNAKLKTLVCTMTQLIAGLLALLATLSALVAQPEVSMAMATLTFIWCVTLDPPFSQ